MKISLDKNKQLLKNIFGIFCHSFIFLDVVQFIYTGSEIILQNTPSLYVLSIALKILYVLLLLFSIVWIFTKYFKTKKIYEISKRMILRYWAMYFVYLWCINNVRNSIFFDGSRSLGWYSINIYNPTPWGNFILDGSFKSYFIVEYLYQLIWSDTSALFFIFIPIYIYIRFKLNCLNIGVKNADN